MLGKLWPASFDDLVLHMAFNVGQSDRPKQFRKMIRHVIVPLACLPPGKKCFVEIAELTRRMRFPTILRVIVVEDDEHTARFGSLFHP